MRQSNYVWTIPVRIGDTNKYHLKRTSLTFPALTDFSDGAFSMFGSGAPANPLFGQALQNNGGFESSLDNWQTIAGHPTTLAAGGLKGSPHSGARFFYGGLGPGGDAVVRQEIDLIAAGFTAQDIDGGAALDAQAWLRNWFGSHAWADRKSTR